MTSTIATGAADAIRAFYQEVLGGQEVWSTGGADAGGSLWFLVGSELLEARMSDGDVPMPALLTVDAPEEVAERCWDAGFVVQVRDDAFGRAMLSVVDPLGRRIDLSASARTRLASAIEWSLSTTKSA